MANYKTGSQRYNDKMDKIMSHWREHSVSTKSGKETYDKRFYRENKKGEVVKAKTEALKRAKTKHLKLHPIHYGEEKEE